MKVSIALAMIAALGFAGAALADDNIKSGYPEGKPGRAVDGSTVKSGGREDKPGRSIGRNDGGSTQPVAKVQKKQTAKTEYEAAKPGHRIEKAN